MANERGEQPQSQFTARADNAALKLRQSLQQQGRQVDDSSPVAVGPDGKPPAPPPPEGSYMAQMAAAEQQRAEEVHRQLEAQPVPGTPVEPPAQPLAEGTPPTPEPEREQLSDNAQRRIRELIAEIKAKDQQNQELLDLGRKQGETIAQLQQRMENMAAQHEQLVNANLDSLDPETRMQVMQDARVQQAVEGMEQRLMGKLMPHIQHLEEGTLRTEIARLAESYPAFDIEVHGQLIEQFRKKNPNCTVEQAFRAVAEPRELVSSVASAAAVPPVVPPGNAGSRPRYQPEPQAQQSDPEAELVEEAQRLKALRASDDPADQKAGMNLAHEHLKRRLGLL